MDYTPGRVFDTLFGAHAARVRRRLAARTALTGAAIGLAIGAASALTLYVIQRTGLAHPLHASGARYFRPAFAVLAVIGGAIGWVLARRRQPSDEDVAVFLDQRFGANEAITTAVEARASGGADGDRDALSAVVIKRATEALERAEPRALRLRPVQRRHALGPLLAGALVAVALLPVAPPIVALPAPGTEPAQVTDVRGLDNAIDAMSKIDPRDEAQRERLAKLAEEAKALREKARAGAPQREIQADVAKLAEQIAKEKASLGDGDERAGFEAAMRALKESGALAGAARALGERDLAAFDREMQRLADKSEKESREKAKETLKKAAEAARKNGAENVAKALEDQLKQLEKAEARSEELRALEEALKDATKGERGKPGENGSPGLDPKSSKALADALEKALAEMTPEERKRLEENLKKLAEQAEKNGAPNKEKLKELAEAAKDPEALAKRLKELANMKLESAEAKRGRELGDAGDGMGSKPVPVPGGNAPGGDQPGSGPGQPGEGEGGPGDVSTPGPSNKTPGDPTKKIDGGELRSKADVNATPGGAPGSTHTTRTGSRPGDTANRVGSGALGEAAPDEVGGVNRSDVPEEYRAHVGRYFQP